MTSKKKAIATLVFGETSETAKHSCPIKKAVSASVILSVCYLKTGSLRQTETKRIIILINMFSKWSVNSWHWNVGETLLRLHGFYSIADEFLRIQTTESLDNRQKWQLNCTVFSWFYEVDLIPLYFAPQWLFRWALYNSSIMLIVVLVLPHTATQSKRTSQPSFSFKNKLKIKSCLK